MYYGSVFGIQKENSDYFRLAGLDGRLYNDLQTAGHNWDTTEGSRHTGQVVQVLEGGFSYDKGSV